MLIFLISSLLCILGWIYECFLINSLTDAYRLLYCSVCWATIPMLPRCFLIRSCSDATLLWSFLFPLQQLLSFSNCSLFEQLLSFSSTAALFLLNRCSLSLQQLLSFSLTTALFLFNSWTFSLQQLLSFSSTAVMVIFLWYSTFLFYSCFLPLKQLYWQHAGDYNDTIKSKLGIYYNYTYIEIWSFYQWK